MYSLDNHFSPKPSQEQNQSQSSENQTKSRVDYPTPKKEQAQLSQVQNQTCSSSNPSIQPKTNQPNQIVSVYIIKKTFNFLYVRPQCVLHER